MSKPFNYVEEDFYEALDEEPMNRSKKLDKNSYNYDCLSQYYYQSLFDYEAIEDRDFKKYDLKEPPPVWKHDDCVLFALNFDKIVNTPSEEYFINELLVYD